MKIFVDSSILIEYIKGNQTDLYEALIEKQHQLLINQVVISEFLFHFIAVSANKSPLSVKKSGKIAESFGQRNPLEMLPDFTHINHSGEIAEKGFELMKKFNLLPNDSLILATCSLNDIHNLSSYDDDFVAPCKDLGIKLIKSITDIEN